jgi:hypothetical protein
MKFFQDAMVTQALWEILLTVYLALMAQRESLASPVPREIMAIMYVISTEIPFHIIV